MQRVCAKSAALLWIRMPCRCTAAAGVFLPCGRKSHMQIVEIADAAAFERTLRRLAHQILENNPEPEQVLLVGILRRGVPLAEELARLVSPSAASAAGRRWGHHAVPRRSERARRFAGGAADAVLHAGCRKDRHPCGRRHLHRPHGARRDGGRHPPRPPGTHPAGRDGRPRKCGIDPGTSAETCDGAERIDLRTDAAVRRTMGHSPAKAGPIQNHISKTQNTERGNQS